jgi:hypothetical protein
MAGPVADEEGSFETVLSHRLLVLLFGPLKAFKHMAGLRTVCRSVLL